MLLTLLLTAALHTPPVPQYRLVAGGDPRVVRITATLPIHGNRLRMADWGYPDELRRGWAEFVESLSVRAGGRAIVAVPDSGPSWTVRVPDGTVAQIDYMVRLTHDRHPWETVGGIDGRPAVITGATVWITKALFLVSGEDATPAEVAFDVPAGVVVSTPWERLAGSAPRFRAGSVDELYDNAIVVGRHLHREIAEGEMRFVLAIDPALEADASMITDALDRLARAYAEILGGTARARYLVALRRDSVEDGESFHSSFVQMFSRGDLAARRIIWENTLAHELFHVSTEDLVPADRATVEWFVEGFTDYMASRTLMQLGDIDESAWRRKVGFHLSRYWSSRFMAPERLSLRAAGANKGRNWRLIYGGGATTALVLDLELRAGSTGRVRLDDVYRHLHQRFGRTGTRYTEADVLAAVNAVSGRDWTAFFATYIDGNGPLPPAGEALAKFGYRLESFADEFYVDPDAAATAEPRGRREGWVR